ncbi:MAG TPA: ferritin-like domain-containing protein, partial [Salinimicrobium sp.]|nr:ferritin-like domain-containing protein [Salinimicrobium sp.]
MNLINFIEEFTTDNLTKKTSNRRDVFSTFGNLGKKAALVAIPFGLASTKTKAASFVQDENAAIGALQLALTLEY